MSDALNHTVSYSYEVREDLSDTVWVNSVTEPSSGGSLTYTIAASPGGHGLAGGTAWQVTPCLPGGTSAAATVITDTRLRCGELATGGTGGHLPSYTHHWNYDDQNNVTSTSGLIWRRSASGTVQVPYPAKHMTYGPHGNVLTTQLQGASGPITVSTSSYYGGSKYFQKEFVTDAAGNVTRCDYYATNDPDSGNRGELKWVRDARYNTTGKQIEYTYNQYGQKATETNLNDVVTEYTYGNTHGHLTQVVQDPGTGHLNRTTSMTYDAAGRVVTSTDRKEQVSTFQYNGVGQLATATLPGETVSCNYGANGRTQSMTDGRGTTTITYESGNDRVASVTDPVTGTIGYTYNLLGQKLTTSLPGGGTWTYTYSPGWWGIPKGDDVDSAKPLLEKITDDQGREVEYVCDNLGRLHEVETTPSANCTLRMRYTYDPGSGYNHRGLLMQTQNTRTIPGPMGFPVTETLLQNDYTYDARGIRLTNAISDLNGPIRTETYAYDELSRATSVDYGDGEIQTYTFDAMGNRLSKTVNGASDAYTYNAANMLVTRGGTTYANDANGNTLTGGGRTNTWDGQNRLIQCVFNGVTTAHTYGGDGLRRRTVEGSDTTDFVLDGQAVVRTFLNSSLDRTYLHGARGPEYERVGASDPEWYLYDGLGSVLGTVDKNGNIISTRKYDVYGAVRATTGPGGTKHRFVGNLGHPSEGETGLIYMRARYMDPITGRFASEDPACHGGNWFVYASNCPTSRIDANGQVDLDQLDELAEATKDCASNWIIYKGFIDRFAPLIGRRAAYLIARALNPGQLVDIMKAMIASEVEGARRCGPWGAAAMGCAVGLAVASLVASMIIWDMKMKQAHKEYLEEYQAAPEG